MSGSIFRPFAISLVLLVVVVVSVAVFVYRGNAIRVSAETAYHIAHSRLFLPDKEDFRTLPYSGREEIITGLADRSPEAAWKYLKLVSSDNGELVINDHPLAHAIGNALYKKRGIDGITTCTDEFSFGCFHGVTEEFLLIEGPESILKAEDGCRVAFPGYEGRDNMRYLNCTHGIGHGLLAWEQYNIGRALEHCEALSQSDRCYGGVFMENSDFAPVSLFDTTKHPWSLCAGLDAKYHEQCAWFHPLFLTRVYKMSQKEVIDTCITAPTGELRNVCLKQIGATSAREYKDDIRGIELDCGLIIDVELNASCVIGAAGTVIHYGFKNWEENARALCTHLSEPWASVCSNDTNEVISNFIR